MRCARSSERERPGLESALISIVISITESLIAETISTSKLRAKPGTQDQRYVEAQRKNEPARVLLDSSSHVVDEVLLELIGRPLLDDAAQPQRDHPAARRLVEQHRRPIVELLDRVQVAVDAANLARRLDQVNRHRAVLLRILLVLLFRCQSASDLRLKSDCRQTSSLRMASRILSARRSDSRCSGLIIQMHSTTRSLTLPVKCVSLNL